MSATTANKIPFRTAYSGAIRFTVPSGNGKELKYEYIINDKGQKKLEIVGEKDVYSEIQSFHEECKIENILRKVGVGDYSSFRPDGIYTDVSEVPNNLIESMRALQKIENMWNQLPLETRNKYDNDVNIFKAQAGSEAWLVDTGLIQPKAPEQTPIMTEPETKVETPTETS